MLGVRESEGGMAAREREGKMLGVRERERDDDENVEREWREINVGRIWMAFWS